jgi:hypothetical protein
MPITGAHSFAESSDSSEARAAISAVSLAAWMSTARVGVCCKSSRVSCHCVVSSAQTMTRSMPCAIVRSTPSTPAIREVGAATAARATRVKRAHRTSHSAAACASSSPLSESVVTTTAAGGWCAASVERKRPSSTAFAARSPTCVLLELSDRATALAPPHPERGIIASSCSSIVAFKGNHAVPDTRRGWSGDVRIKIKARRAFAWLLSSRSLAAPEYLCVQQHHARRIGRLSVHRFVRAIARARPS